MIGRRKTQPTAAEAEDRVLETMAKLQRALAQDAVLRERATQLGDWEPAELLALAEEYVNHRAHVQGCEEVLAHAVQELQAARFVRRSR